MLVVEQDARIALRRVLARVRPRGRPRRAHGTSAELQGRRVRPPELPRATDGRRVLRRVHAAGRLGPRVGRHLRAPRARARDHPPLDRSHQLRAGRDGDALDVHRLDADVQPRLELLAGVRRNARRLVRRRRRHPPRGHPAGRARKRAAHRHRHDRPARRHQRLHHLAVERRAAAAREPVRHGDVRHRRRHRVGARDRDDRRRARDRAPALGALPVHEARPRAARGGGESRGGAPRRRARDVDARARLGPRGDARRRRRAADRAHRRCSTRT